MTAEPFISAAEHEDPMPGDWLINDAKKQTTRSIVIDAAPAVIWPQLVRMVLHDRDAGGAVLYLDAPHALVLGSLYDARAHAYLPFEAPRPAEHWRATWALSLSPLDATRTCLRVRSRVAFTGDALRWTAVWMHPFHDFMARDELRRLKHAAEASGAPAGRREALGLVAGEAPGSLRFCRSTR
jgi:hypothetical protein